MRGLTSDLAAFVARARVTNDVRERARKPLIDTIGVILSGASSEVAAPLIRYLNEQYPSGSSPVLGTSRTAPPEVAAMVNGTFGHALDYDDAIALAPMHPSSVVVAALLAKPAKLDGAMLLDAYTIGVEVSVRLSVAIGIEHYYRGWHETGTLGVFGGVAALAYAWRLNPSVIQTALGLAASMASGVQRNYGTMTKPLHSGWAARSAVTAVELASAGFSAAQDALESPNGFFAVYGTQDSNPARVMQEIGNPFVVLSPGVSLKRYACCYASHRPIEGILALRKEMGFDSRSVESVRCFLAPGGLRALIYPRPRTGLEGKFSLEYALAAGIIDPKYSLWTFSDEAVMRPEAQELLPRITLAEDPRCAVDDPDAMTRGPSRRGFVEVYVDTRDGRRAMRRVDKLPGSLDQELSLEEVQFKFIDCARTAGLSSGQANAAFDQLMALEKCADVSSILKLLQV